MEQHGAKIPNGCNDPLAENYDEGTIFNDGSCEYPENGDYSLFFNGPGDLVEIPYSANLDLVGENPFSISFDVKLTANGYVFNTGDGGDPETHF